MNKKFKIKGKLTNIEEIKKNSNFLRGTISKDLEDNLTGGFNGDNYLLIRFHGMYQQDDRDIRALRVKQKLEPRYAMMLRCRLPGGLINSKQWFEIDNFSKIYTIYKSIRITNRQTFQFHGIFKKNLKIAHKTLNSVNLDSIATANDVNRNVLCTSNIMNSKLYKILQNYSKIISEYLLPKSNAYSEIWLDKKKNKEKENEIILGKTYLPRKFKISITVPPYNDIDIHANDIGFIAIIKNEEILGFNFLIGGGLSMEHKNKLTWPRLGTDFGFIKKEEILNVTKAIVTIQRDWGNRTNRKNAKTKYTLERVGIKEFKKEIEKRSKVKIKPIYPYELKNRSDKFGWKKDKNNNKWYLTLFIENGRILDSSEFLLKTAIYEIAKIHLGEFKLTANQNIIISEVEEKNKEKINLIINKYNLIKKISKQRKNSMACVSFPTCPLAMAEAERFIPLFIDKIENILSKYNLKKEFIVLRISGCPNGCARAMLSEIGLIGKSLNYYNLYIGGNKSGTRIPKLYLENINEKEILFNIEKLIKIWSLKKIEKEDFGDFCIRYKIIKPVNNSPKDFW